MGVVQTKEDCWDRYRVEFGKGDERKIRDWGGQFLRKENLVELAQVTLIANPLRDTFSLEHWRRIVGMTKNLCARDKITKEVIFNDTNFTGKISPQQAVELMVALAGWDRDNKPIPCMTVRFDLKNICVEHSV